MNVQKSFKKGKRTLIGLLFLTLCSGCANAETIRIEEPVKHINSSNIVKKDTIKEKDIDLLGKIIYHESRGESKKGQYGVAIVTMNRVKTIGFPNTIYGVVTQKGQYPWYNKKDIHKITDKKSFDVAKEIAKNVINEDGTLYNEVNQKLKGALYFRGVHEKWNKKKNPVTTIGKHNFYI